MPESPYGFFVVGPESSGTRFVTQLFLDAGCEGDAGHVQRFDDAWPVPTGPIVWRRSLPHGGVMPDLTECLMRIHDNGLTPVIVLCMRDWHATATSQVRLGLAYDMEDAYKRIRAALNLIADTISQRRCAWEFVSYESLLHLRVAPFNKLAQRYGLMTVDRTPIVDGDLKYYHQEGL